MIRFAWDFWWWPLISLPLKICFILVTEACYYNWLLIIACDFTIFWESLGIGFLSLGDIHLKKVPQSTLHIIERLTTVSFIARIANFWLSGDPLIYKLFLSKTFKVASVFASILFKFMRFFPITLAMQSSGMKVNFFHDPWSGLSSPWLTWFKWKKTAWICNNQGGENYGKKEGGMKVMQKVSRRKKKNEGGDKRK